MDNPFCDLSVGFWDQMIFADLFDQDRTNEMMYQLILGMANMPDLEYFHWLVP